MADSDLVLSVSDFVGLLNQTLEYTYPEVVIVGELSNFRVSKNRWVYFDLKDEYASVKFFGTVYGLPGPLEDGLMLQVRGTPRLHPLYGFSVTFQSIQPVGEGSLRRAAALLEAKLAAEGLFDPARKRPLPYPPERIGLITSRESAAYHDFVKILNERWGGIEIQLADVQVQGEAAPRQIAAALDYFDTSSSVEAVIITRGGGSAEDLAAFNTELVTRAVAGCRIPTLVAIGHEVDISLAELAADQRASTPSNAAELLTPDRRHVLQQLTATHDSLRQLLIHRLQTEQRNLSESHVLLESAWDQYFSEQRRTVSLQSKLLEALNPAAALKRGYAIIRQSGRLVRSGKNLKPGDSVAIELNDAAVKAVIDEVRLQ